MGRTNRREFAFKQEATPGVAETIASSDVFVKVERDVVPAPDVEQIDLNEAQATSDPQLGLTGRSVLDFPVQYVLRAPGDLVTAPAIAPLIEAAMFDGAAAKSVNIGSVTSGPFVAGEVITSDGAGSPTGLVLQETADGASLIPYIPLTGTIGSTETITGGTSGATATTSAGEADAGYAFRPADSDFEAGSSLHHGTMKYLQDGVMFEARGVLGDLEASFRNGHPCRINQRLLGAFSNHGDQALFGVTAYPEASVSPPRFLAATLRMGAYSPTDIVEFTLTADNGLNIREDANDNSADGVRFAGYGDKSLTVSFDPALPKPSTKDIFQELKDGTAFSMEWTLGSLGPAGERWTFSAPKAQFESIGLGDRDRLATAPMTIRLTGDNNNSLLIWQH